MIFLVISLNLCFWFLKMLWFWVFLIDNSVLTWGKCLILLYFVMATHPTETKYICSKKIETKCVKRCDGCVYDEANSSILLFLWITRTYLWFYTSVTRFSFLNVWNNRLYFSLFFLCLWILLSYYDYLAFNCLESGWWNI